MARRKSLMGTLKTQRGITLVEVMIAAFLLLVTFLGLATTYSRGRVQIDLEEDRRRATCVAQARFDGIRRDLAYENLGDLDDTVTTFVVDGINYQVSHNVVVGTPESQATTLVITVNWNAIIDGNPIPRSVVSTTILARSLGWAS